MNNVYEICFYGGLILAIIFLLLSIILFIVLKIPKVFGELTGRAAKKGIKEKQQGNVADTSVAKKEQAKYYNQNTGKIKVRDAVSQETRASNMDDTTDNLTIGDDQSKNPEFKPQFDADETAVLGASPELDSQIAMAGMSIDGEDATNLLAGDASEDATNVLSSNSFDESDAATDVLRAVEPDESDAATDVLRAEEPDESDGATDVLKAEEPDESDGATDVLKSDDAENVPITSGMDVDDDPTDVLRSDADEDATDVLRGNEAEDADSTTVLTSGKTRQLASKVKVIYNYVVVNTNERI